MAKKGILYQQSKLPLGYFGWEQYSCISMKNCYIKASGFLPKTQPGLVATTRPQGWRRMGPGVVKWPCVCDLKCECGRSGILNVISCDAVNYGCQLSTVNHCQLSSAQIGVNSQRNPVNSCHVQPCTDFKGEMESSDNSYQFSENYFRNSPRQKHHRPRARKNKTNG